MHTPSGTAFAAPEDTKNHCFTSQKKKEYMGFVVLYMEKAHGSDSGMTTHIERFIIPKNVDPTRMHLNRRLIEYHNGSERPFGGYTAKIRRSGAYMQNRKQPSTGYPHQRIGNARGHEADRRRGVFGRVVRQQSEILRRHLRKREHRGGSPAQGRGNAAHTDNGSKTEAP